MKKVLVACERSQILTKCLLGMGVDAYSCDTEQEYGGLKDRHIQRDVMEIVNDGWLAIIAFPPCTYLSSAGNAYFNIEKYGDKAIERREKRCDAFSFFLSIYNADCKHVAIENPVGFVNSHFRKPDQILHPYYFGGDRVKRTCFWLRGMPKLHYSEKPMPEPIYIDSSGRKRYYTDAFHGRHPDTKRLRSEMCPYLAQAMAEQWSPLLRS